MHIFEEDEFKIYRFIADPSDNNYNYIVSCNVTNECVIIDPIDVIQLLNIVREKELKVKYVINTHAHPDHIHGNDPIIKVFLSSKILIHESALDYVSPRSEGIKDGETIIFGKQNISVTHTPGHCPEHISLIIGSHIFVGDTIFVSGCGNVKYRGDVEQLYDTYINKLMLLDENLIMHCGHNYAKTNLEYALSIEPNNQEILNKLNEIEKSETIISTLGEEKTYNPFMRINNTDLVSSIMENYPDLDNNPKSIFIKLRELRDNW